MTHRQKLEPSWRYAGRQVGCMWRRPREGCGQGRSKTGRASEGGREVDMRCGRETARKLEVNMVVAVAME